MTRADLEAIEAIKDRWSSQGRRVIVVARKTLPARLVNLSPTTREFKQAVMEEGNAGLELVGLLGLVDPPRDEIPDVVRTLRGAGIKIYMATGDFKLTAQAIAAECGIITSEQVDGVAALDACCATPDKSSSLELSATNIRYSIVLSGPEMVGLDEAQ